MALDARRGERGADCIRSTVAVPPPPHSVRARPPPPAAGLAARPPAPAPTTLPKPPPSAGCRAGQSPRSQLQGKRPDAHAGRNPAPREGDTHLHEYSSGDERA